jgi:hypothetical protein
MLPAPSWPRGLRRQGLLLADALRVRSAAALVTAPLMTALLRGVSHARLQPITWPVGGAPHRPQPRPSSTTSRRSWRRPPGRP